MAIHDADRDRSHLGLQGVRGDQFLTSKSSEGQRQRQVGSRNRGGPGASVGLENVAIEAYREACELG
jgi:hypothetical protein